MEKTLLLLCFVGMCVGSKILVVFPTPSRSHGILGESVVKTLLDAGHEVTYVTMHSQKITNPRLKYVNISSIMDQTSEIRKSINLMQLAYKPRPVHRIIEIGSSLAQQTLLHPNVRDLLDNTAISFDAVLIEWFFSDLLAPIAAVYECPLIWYIATDVHWLALRLVDEPTNSAYTVDLQSRQVPTRPYSAGERAYQLWLRVYLTAWMYYVSKYIETPMYHEIYRTPLLLRGRALPEYESLVYNGSLLLVNSFPPLGQPLPLPQNTKYIGGHHIDFFSKPLPTSLQNILDNAEKGVIYFSLGSNLKSKDFPEHMKQGLLNIFEELEQIVIWKFEEELESVPENVHIADWVPQTSILNHQNTVLFITHGGLLSIMEATRYGIPFIGIPLFGDQFVNMDLAVARGCGLRVDFTEELPWVMKQAINEVISNSSYKQNARQSSAIFRNRLTSPQTELTHWVQLVIETGGAPHLRSLALWVPMYEKLHLDILVSIAMLFWFFTKVMKVIRVHLSATIGDLVKKDE